MSNNNPLYNDYQPNRLKVDKELVLPSSNSDDAGSLQEGAILYDEDLKKIRYKDDTQLRTIGGGINWTMKEVGVANDGTDQATNLGIAFDNAPMLWAEDGNITINDTVDAQGKVLKFSRGAKIIGTGTLTNVQIEAGENDVCFGPNLTVTNLLNSEIHLSWFGFINDFSSDKTNNIPIFQKALASSPLPRLVTPISTDAFGDNEGYYFNGDLTIDKDFELICRGVYQRIPTTMFWFPVDSPGIVLEPGIEASITNLIVRQENWDPDIDGDTDAHAFTINCFVKFDNVWAYGWHGNGFHIYADNSIPSNADQSVFNNCEAQYCLDGWFIDGNDTNIIHYTNIGAVWNKQCGIYSNGELGSVFSQPHFAFNGLKRKSLVLHDGIYYQAINPRTTTNLNKPPDTEPNFWRIAGTGGDGSGGVNITYAEEWEDDITYFCGGTWHFANENARDVLFNPYTEGSQVKGIGTSRTKVIHGLMETDATGGYRTFVQLAQFVGVGGGFQFYTVGSNGEPDLAGYQNKIEGKVEIIGTGQTLALDSNNATQLGFRFNDVFYGAIGSHSTSCFRVQNESQADMLLIDQAGKVQLVIAPTTSAGSYDILTRNSSTGVVEKIVVTGTLMNGTGAANKVPYFTDADTQAVNTNFHFDNTNTRLGIGNAAPDTTLHVTGNTTLSGAVFNKVSTATDADYTVAAGDYIIMLPTITADRGITLPTGAAQHGRRLVFRNIYTGSDDWVFNPTQVVPYGATTATLGVLPQGATITLFYDHTTALWYVETYNH